MNNEDGWNIVGAPVEKADVKYFQLSIFQVVCNLSISLLQSYFYRLR